MIKEILVCLEGSPSSGRATESAIALARELGAALVGLAIVDEPDIRAGAATSIGGASFKHERDDALVADARKQAGEWAAEFERRCGGAGVVARALEVTGRPAQSILAEMEKRDLVVMGREANFRFETDADDTKTRATILRQAMRPVLVVPEAAGEMAGAALIAFDGSRSAKRAIESFAASGLAAQRQVHVATVDDSGAAAWEMANRAVEMLAVAGVRASAHNVVSVLSTTDALLELQGKLGAGLLVMGAYARTRLAELLRGSVTDDIISKATIPLYLCH